MFDTQWGGRFWRNDDLNSGSLVARAIFGLAYIKVKYEYVHTHIRTYVHTIRIVHIVHIVHIHEQQLNSHVSNWQQQQQHT